MKNPIIKAYLGNNGLQARELADLLNIDRAYTSRALNCSYIPSRHAHTIAAHLGYEVLDIFTPMLFGRTEKETSNKILKELGYSDSYIKFINSP
jgi:hypothetical protein